MLKNKFSEVAEREVEVSEKESLKFIKIRKSDWDDKLLLRIEKLQNGSLVKSSDKSMSFEIKSEEKFNELVKNLKELAYWFKGRNG